MDFLDIIVSEPARTGPGVSPAAKSTEHRKEQGVLKTRTFSLLGALTSDSNDRELLRSASSLSSSSVPLGISGMEIFWRHRKAHQ